MTPMESAVQRLVAIVQAERDELEYISGSLALARGGGLHAAAERYAQRYCQQLDRLWAAQENLKAFNPSFTMAREDA